MQKSAKDVRPASPTGRLIPAILAAWLLGGATLHATPYIPGDDSEVLEHVLPNTDHRMQDIRKLAALIAQSPGDENRALTLASRQLALGVAESDPRFVGYAQGTLAPWWHGSDPSIPLQVLRARILQAQHNFTSAKQDLEQVLHKDPNYVEAHLVLAGVDEATGDLGPASQHCAEAGRIRPSLAAIACAASVDSVSGYADRAYASLTLATSRARSKDPVLQSWALTVLAEIEDRRNDPGAGQHFTDALAQHPNDVYILTAYADYLLAHDRAADVSRLLAGKERIDALLLRLAIAARDTGDSRLPDYIVALADRYTAAQALGQSLHLRDESRFELDLRGNSSRALELARQNWAVQRTPLDARIYLAAAQAASSGSDIKIVAKFVADTRLEDFRLQDLATRQTAAAQ